MYFTNANIASVPTVAKVLQTKANTPYGANNIIKFTIFIHTSFALSNITFIGSAFFPTIFKATPVNSAKNITCNISPFAKDCIGLVGIIFNIISTNDFDYPIVTSPDIILLISKPTPGLNTIPKNNAVIIAIAVVDK